MIPKFSVIIPTFNRAKLISRALDSVLAQTYQNFEIIVIDDASTDSTATVVSQCNDERIKYIKMLENKGPSAARNRGIKKARGEYISLLDSDDEYLPEFLDATLKTLENSGKEVGFSWTGTIYTSKKETDEILHEQIVKRLWSPNYKNRDEAFKDCLSWDPMWGTGHGVTIKASAFEKVGLLDETMKAREDIDLLIRLVKEHKFKTIPQFLVKIHLDGKVRVDENYLNRARAYIKIYNKYPTIIRNNRDSYLFFNRIIAKNFFKANHYMKSIRFLFNILMQNSKNFSIYKLTLLSFIRQSLKIIPKK